MQVIQRRSLWREVGTRDEDAKVLVRAKITVNRSLVKQALAGRIVDSEVEIRGKLHEVPECILRELNQETALFVGDGQAKVIIEEEVLVECSYDVPGKGTAGFALFNRPLDPESQQSGHL